MCCKNISHTSFKWPSLFQLITFTCPILLQIKWQTCQKRRRYFPRVVYKMTSMAPLRSCLNTLEHNNKVSQTKSSTERVSKLQKWWVMMLQETNKERGFLLCIVALWVISRRISKGHFFYLFFFFKKPHYVQIKASAFAFLCHCWMEKSVHQSTSFKGRRPYLPANSTMACSALANHNCKTTAKMFSLRLGWGKPEWKSIC